MPPNGDDRRDRPLVSIRVERNPNQVGTGQRESTTTVVCRSALSLNFLSYGRWFRFAERVYLIFTRVN